MKIGKVSETVLKRSVFKQIRTKRKEVILGASVGEDCAAIKLEPDETFVISTDPITGTVKDIGSLSVHITANDLASAGAEPVGIMLTVLLPQNTYESDLKEMMKQVEETCSELNIQIMGGHTEITNAVNQPIISVSGIGKVKDGFIVSTGGAKPGQDIVITKWIGLEGTSIIAKEHEEELLTKYPKSLIESAKGFDRYISVVKEAAEAVKSGASAMHDVTEGGIYGALWEMAEASGVGLEIDLKKISIKQETVEICEFYNINPYYLISSGCMLIAIENGHDLVRNLEKLGIDAAVIGKAVKGKDRIVLNEDEKRFLEPPKSDEIYNVKSVERLENQI